MQIETLGVYRLWQNEEARIINCYRPKANLLVYRNELSVTQRSFSQRIKEIITIQKRIKGVMLWKIITKLQLNSCFGRISS